jgi:hypothetical protein
MAARVGIVVHDERVYSCSARDRHRPDIGQDYHRPKATLTNLRRLSKLVLWLNAQRRRRTAIHFGLRLQTAIRKSKVSNSIMNRITILLIATLAVIAGCSRRGIKGDGVIKSETRPISDFSELVVTGGYQIKWSSGKPTLTISTDQNLLPLIKTMVTGNTLQIESEENLAPTKGITITISSASLADVQLTGAIRLAARQLSGHDLKLEANGASNISVDGSVTNLEANLSGASKLNAKSLQTQTATLSLDGASYGDVTVTETLNASISGAGVLTYSGNPKSVEKNISGAGSIRSRP